MEGGRASQVQDPPHCGGREGGIDDDVTQLWLKKCTRQSHWTENSKRVTHVSLFLPKMTNTRGTSNSSLCATHNDVNNNGNHRHRPDGNGLQWHKALFVIYYSTGNLPTINIIVTLLNERMQNESYYDNW
jgi:hypothetical protein